MAGDLAESSSSGRTNGYDIQGLNELYNDLVTALAATFDLGGNKDTAESAKRLGAVREQLFDKCNELVQNLVVLQQNLSSGQSTSVQQQWQQEHNSAGHASGAAQPDNIGEVAGQQLQLQSQQEDLLAVQQQSAQAVAAMVQQHRLFVQQVRNTTVSAEDRSAG